MHIDYLYATMIHIPTLTRSKLFFFLAVILSALMFTACDDVKKRPGLPNFEYKAFKDSILTAHGQAPDDSTNLFDEEDFFPDSDPSLDSLLGLIDTLWRNEAQELEKESDLGNAISEKRLLKENQASLDSFNAHRRDTVLANACEGIDCMLYVEIVKSTQTMYLYIGGELVDSFLVSTGIKGHETPEMSRRPAGPVFSKYTSRKYPGGNYKGLGNMPYAVFIRGGYAIHGTTPGNFAKLGSPASHGCIRVHPNNAIIFQALVRRAGLNQTWVTIKDERDPEL
ncbi:MAG TPA: L,D-transpeptidase [Phnomibacter sp.]|nr:L,D-transpeptidase [Phnomibacter sp.]